MIGIKCYFRDKSNQLTFNWLNAPKEHLSKKMRVLVFDTEVEAKQYIIRINQRKYGIGWFEPAIYDGEEETIKMYW